MTYQEAEQYLKTIYNTQIRLGLGRMHKLLENLGNPQDDLKFIHVAGTNGKGSVCAMTAQILQCAGFHTGLFTSPVICDYREQFQVNGQKISQEDFIRFTLQIKNVCDDMPDPPSEFEKVVALALLFFKQSKCDFVVFEVGLGGAEDATNVISVPEVAVITTIDFDHMGFLGNSLEEIALQKAGIIKKNGTVVLAKQATEAMKVLCEVCRKQGAKVYETEVTKISIRDRCLDGQYFDYKNHQNMKLSLLGNHQCENASVVLEIMDALIEKGYVITETAICQGLQNVTWQGRFEVVKREPVFLIDGAHNPNGITALRDNLQVYFPGEKWMFLTGILADKDYSAMLKQMIPLAAGFVTIAPDNPRAMSAVDCAEAIRKLGFEGEILPIENIGDAVETVLKRARDEQIGACAFGSLYSVGAMKLAMKRKEDANGKR